MHQAQKEWAGAAVTARPVVSFRGENNMNKGIEQPAAAQPKRRVTIPDTIPRLVISLQGTFLVYGGLRIPATADQARRHTECLRQYLMGGRHAS